MTQKIDGSTTNFDAVDALNGFYVNGLVAVTATGIYIGGVKIADATGSFIGGNQVVSSSGLLSGGLLSYGYAEVTLTAAQVKALNTTPISLIASPGTGKAIRVKDIVASVDYGSAAYTTNTTLEFRYTNGSGTKVTADVANLLTATADKVESVSGVASELVLTAAAPIVVTAASGNPADGDSPVKIRVYYSVVAI